MSRRRPVPELDVNPEDLMQIRPVSVGGVSWTGISATRWWYCGVNTGAEYICALSPKGDEPTDDSHKAVKDHILRIRAWLRENPEPTEIKHLAPVDRLFPRRRRLWQAVLATWDREQVEMATAAYGPLGCFNDDTPGTPFTTERCRELMRGEVRTRLGDGGLVLQEGAAQ